MDINKILLDLEIIKQIENDDKLAVLQEKGETKLYVHYSSYFLSLKRWYYGYTRDDTILYLEKLLDSIDKSSIVIINGNHFELANLLKNSIYNSLKGLNNLKITYNDDSIINSKIILIENKLKSIFNLLSNFVKSNINNIDINNIDNIDNIVINDNNNNDDNDDNYNNNNENIKFNNHNW